MATCPNDEEMRDAFTRLVTTRKGFWLECLWIRRRGTRMVIEDWIPVKSLPLNTPDPVRVAERQEALENPDFFGICEQCGKRYALSQSREHDDCETCAQRPPKKFR